MWLNVLPRKKIERTSYTCALLILTCNAQVLIVFCMDYVCMKHTVKLCTTQPAVQRVAGTLYPGCEADLSPPTNAEVKNRWIYTCIRPYMSMV
jgi:hypothetical protein